MPPQTHPSTSAPGLRSRLKGYLRTNWSRDPFSFGAYSFVATGSSQNDRHVLREPIEDRIFFAGEAVHPKFNSSVHGAYESGLLVAEDVKKAGARRVAVVGAGISGLATAHTLAEAGMEVEVFEARDRLGGRLWSNDTLGFPLDLGASWIHGVDGNPLTRLSNQLGLIRVKTDNDGVTRGVKEEEPASLTAWIGSMFESIGADAQTMAGADLEDVNVWSYLFRDQFYPGDEVIFPNGYSAILEALRGPYKVHLNTPVSRIAMEDAGIRITLGDTENSESWDAVIVTVPLGVLKRPDGIVFDPPLSESKRGAIERLGMGTLDKLYLHFDEPFWDRDASWIRTPDNGLPPGQFRVWLNLFKFVGVPVLLGFNGGSAALALAEVSDEEVLHRALSTLESAYAPTCDG